MVSNIPVWCQLPVEAARPLRSYEWNSYVVVTISCLIIADVSIVPKSRHQASLSRHECCADMAVAAPAARTAQSPCRCLMPSYQQLVETHCLI